MRYSQISEGSKLPTPQRLKRGIPIVQRLLSRMKIDQETGCWNYTWYINDQGYGRIFYKGRSRAAHRTMLMITSGEERKGYDACHTCDNRKCINPDHLWWGTMRENQADKVKKGRNYTGDQRGSKNPGSKLKEEDIPKIREILSTNKYQQKEVAKMFNVSETTITVIKQRKNWSHVS